MGSPLLHVEALLHGNVLPHGLRLALAPNLLDTLAHFLLLHDPLQLFAVLPLHELFASLSLRDLAIVLLSLLPNNGAPLVDVADAVSRIIALLLSIEVVYDGFFHFPRFFDTVRVQFERVVLLFLEREGLTYVLHFGRIK